MYTFSNIHLDGEGNLHATLPPQTEVVVPFDIIVNRYLNPRDYAKASHGDLVDILTDWVWQFDVC